MLGLGSCGHVKQLKHFLEMADHKNAAKNHITSLARHFGVVALTLVALLSGTTSAYAACTNPAGVEGEVIYNTDYATMQFCDNTNWVSMAASGSATAELDPKVGAMTSSAFCRANAGATQVVCGTTAINLATDITGNLAIARLNSGSGASATTFWRGDGTWGTPVLPSLNSGQIWIGNGSNVATAITITGDVTITNAGVSAIGAGKVTNSMLAGSIDLATKVTGNLPIANLGSGSGASATTFWRGDGTWATAGSTASGVAGAVQFSSGSNLASDAANFFWDNSTKRLGIGLNAPTESIHTTGNVKSVMHKFIAQTGWAAPGTVSGGSVGTLTANYFCTANATGTQVVCTTSGIGIGNISATGTASATTYLRGDGAWTAPPVASPSGTSGAIQFTNGTAFTSDVATFFWDNTNKRLGIGNGAPTVKLDVSGAIVSRANNAGASMSIDWAASNTAYTSASCGSFAFSNMQDGGTYNLFIQGTAAATCSFSHAGLSFRYPPGHGATTNATMTVYTFTRVGAYVFVAWIPGY